MKMMNPKSMRWLLMVAGLLIFATAAFPVVAVNNSGGIAGTSARSQNTVSQRVELVKEIKNNTLYTDGGIYKLDGIEVKDLTNRVKGYQGKRNLAQLTFVNGILKEVVIRP